MCFFYIKLLALHLQMRDVFYTLLVVWIIWRVLNSISAYGTKRSNNVNDFNPNKMHSDGETSIEYAPPVKKKISDDEGEYVDYEEMK